MNTVSSNSTYDRDIQPKVETLDEFDTLLGDVTSPLDRVLTVTEFPDRFAFSTKPRQATLRQLAAEVHRPLASEKDRLPLLKLATFGDVLSEGKSVRHDENVIQVDGLELDYDGEKISTAEGAAVLERVQVAGLLFTSPSHKPDAPRWRLLCPLSRSCSPEERERYCARINGALGGILAGESFTLSQSYFFGRVRGGAVPEVRLIDGRAIDCADDLDASALGKDAKPYTRATTPPADAPHDDDCDDFALSEFRVPNLERLRSALAAVPIEAADMDGGRISIWLPIGMAIHDETGGSDEGLALWDEWSKPGAKYNARDLRRDWKSFGKRSSGKRVTLGTLCDIAKGFGWKPEPAEQPQPHKPSRLRFLKPSECASAPSRGYIVKGLLAPGDVACIYGAPGAGKSLIAPHIGYQVALGQPAFGMRTKPGLIFYVAAEDPHGMRGRVTALRKRHGDAPDFELVEDVSDLLTDKSEDLKALRAAIAERKPALIFLDTLALSFPGLEENTAEAMGKVVAIARSMTKHGAAVVLIHHDTKAQTPTPRGHSLLNGALDIALQLFQKEADGVVRGKLSKNRNGSCDRDIAFRIATENLGTDADGDPINVALVDELQPGAAPRREKLSKAESAALAELIRMSREAPEVLEAHWREACINGRSVCGSDKPDSRATAFNRAFSNLCSKGAVIAANGLVALPSSDFSGCGFDDEADE